MLVRRTLSSLDDEELEHFLSAVHTDKNSGGAANVADNLKRNNLDLFVWRTDDSVCVLMTRIGECLDGTKEIFVVMLAGSNATSYYNEICDQVIMWGKNIWGAERMTALIDANSWEAFQRHGANADEEYVYIIKEPTEVE